MNIKKDALGNELKIGDKVSFTGTNKSFLIEGKIFKFTANFAKIIINNKEATRMTRKYKSVIKLFNQD
jgi:hypothetical protein